MKVTEVLMKSMIVAKLWDLGSLLNDGNVYDDKTNPGLSMKSFIIAYWLDGKLEQKIPDHLAVCYNDINAFISSLDNLRILFIGELEAFAHVIDHPVGKATCIAFAETLKGARPDDPEYYDQLISAADFYYGKSLNKTHG